MSFSMSIDAKWQIHNFLVTAQIPAGLAKWGLPGRNKNSTVSKAAARISLSRNRMSNPHTKGLQDKFMGILRDLQPYHISELK